MVREVQEAYEQLLEQRAELQRKVHSLIHAQKQAMPSPLATQVRLSGRVEWNAVL